MKRKYFLIAILVAAVIFAKGQTARLTLNECIETALKNNITVKQRELQSQAAAISYQQAKNNRLPSVQSSYSYSINNGRSIDNFTNTYINQQIKLSDVSAQASIPIFNGFLLKNTIKQNELAFSSAKMEWQQRKDELTLQVILAYLQVLSGEDAMALAKQQTELTKQQFDRISIIGNEGAAPPGNVSDLKGQYAGDEVNYINAENNYQSAVLALTQLMMVPYSDQLQFDRTGLAEDIAQFPSTPDEIYSQALQKLAAVKAVNFRVGSSVAAVKAARSNLFPTVSLFGGAYTNFSSSAGVNKLVRSFTDTTSAYIDNSGVKLPVLVPASEYKSVPISYTSQFKNNISTGFGVSVNIPIFSALRTRSAIKLAKNDELNSRLVAESVKWQLRQSIDQAYININATARRYNALKEQADAYAESLRIASLRFENGVINSPEYLIAKNNAERVNANIIIAKYEYLLRKKILEFYMGKL